jgi:ABC-type phosphate transport system substrate-binding protein
MNRSNKEYLMKMMTSALALAAVAAFSTLSGCADTSTLTYLPTGETGFAINCSGGDASTSWAACYKKAGETCGSYGYDVVSKDGDNGATAGGSIAGIFGTNIKNRSMVIRCKQ